MTTTEKLSPDDIRRVDRLEEAMAELKEMVERVLAVAREKGVVE